MDNKSRQHRISYTVGIPAAASFSKFSQFGYYNAANPPTYFRLETNYEPAITQLRYIQAAILSSLIFVKVRISTGLIIGDGVSINYQIWRLGNYFNPLLQEGRS